MFHYVEKNLDVSNLSCGREVNKYVMQGEFQSVLQLDIIFHCTKRYRKVQVRN